MLIHFVKSTFFKVRVDGFPLSSPIRNISVFHIFIIKVAFIHIPIVVINYYGDRLRFTDDFMVFTI